MNTLGSVSAFGWLVVLAGATALAPLTPAQREAPPKEIRKSQSPCPRVFVSCPSDVKDGEAITFSVTVQDADPATVLTYSWSVANGTILEGQGTPEIKLKPSGAASFTGSVRIGGLDPSCSSTASCSLMVCRNAPLSRKFDSYEVVASDQEVKKLASFADALDKEPGAGGYVLSFARRGGSAEEAKASLYRAQTYLVSVRGIDAGRIVTVEGGFKDQPTIELWVVPSGAARPKTEESRTPEEPRKTANSSNSP